MFKKTRNWMFVVTGVVLFGALLLVSQTSLMQSKEATKQVVDTKLPEGNWAVSFHPYLQDDYVNSPVIVTSVTNKNAAVSSFTIFNLSNKEVEGLRLKWLVYGDDSRQKVLNQGETPFMQFFETLKPGKGGKITYSAVSLQKFYQQFLENGRLNREFQVELVVDEVRFSDETRWKKGDVNFINTTFAELARSATPCSMQKCKTIPNPDIRGGVTYTCEPSTARETCTNTRDQYSCTTSACDAPGGGGGDIEIILN